MTRQEIREKASEFVSTRASGMPKEMDYYAEILTEFATEVTKELEKENAELKSLKDVADLISLNNSHIVAMVQLNNNNVALRKENAELKLDNDARKFAMAMSEKEEKQLREENAELKEKLTAIRNAKDKYDMSKDKSIIKALGAEYTLFCDLERILEDWQEDDKLTKAMKHLKDLAYVVELGKNELATARILAEVRQFLSEEKK